MNTGTQAIISPTRNSMSDLIDTVSGFLGSQGFLQHFPSTTGRNVLTVRNPETVQFNKKTHVRPWPIPQTQIPRLQEELLTRNGRPKIFSVMPEEGRIEFVQRGGSNVLFEFATTFADRFFGKIPERLTYDGIVASLAASVIDEKVAREIGRQLPHCLITNFPERAGPSWNVKRLGDGATGGFFRQVDLCVHGLSVMSSFEFSCNPEEMKQSLERTHGKKFAKVMREKFGATFDTQLKRFLRLKFQPHCGGNIDLARFAQAKQENQSNRK